MAGLLDLLVTETKASIFARGLSAAQSLGLTVTSWVTGDPTRSLYWFLAEILSVLEVNVAGFMSSGFLDYASGDWLTVLANQVYNVDRVLATYATTQVTLTNNGGGLYVIEVGDLTVKSTSGKTYRNTSAGTLLPGPTTSLVLDFTADEAGSASNAGAGEINDLVTSLLGVTCSNANAAVGLDDESDDSLRDRCRAKLGMLSPNGPRDAFNYVVRSSDLTGVTDITRARTVGDTTTGAVTTYVAGASGPVATASVTAAQAAVNKWAAPICTTPTVTNATGVSVAVAYTAYIYQSVGETTATIQAKHSADLAAMFSARPIGGDVIPPATSGSLYRSLIEATLKASYPNHTFRIDVTTPSGDTALTIGQVATLGAVTGTINLVADP